MGLCSVACVLAAVLTCRRPCCAAFEATRFYNVSENSPLARELCDGPTCNEVESSNNQWPGEPRVRTPPTTTTVSPPALLKLSSPPGFVQAGQCNNVFGCLQEQRHERCTCYRDCGYDGEPVCGSDGQLHRNLCQMEVFACRNGSRIKQVPPSQCPHGETPTANQRREGGVLGGKMAAVVKYV